jgi:hypothetical protein
MINNINKLKITLSKNNNLVSKSKLNGDINTQNKIESSKLKESSFYSNDSNNNSKESVKEDDIDINDNTIATGDDISVDTNKTPVTSIDTNVNEPESKPLITPREVNRYEFDNESDIGFDRYPETTSYNNPYANPYDIYNPYNLKTNDSYSNKLEKTETNNLNTNNNNNNNNTNNEFDEMKSKRKSKIPDSIITIQRNATENYQQPICISSLPLDEDQILFSELSTIEMIQVGPNIVECLIKLLRQENLATQVDISNLLDKKESMWGKLIGSLKQNQKKQKVKDKTFGVLLENITEKHGTESKFGAGNGNIRVPLLIEKLISHMRGMDLNVEGIYRKNGNIKQLKILSDAIDKSPGDINLKGNSPIQLAALMKKFLRDLPNPVLTFKLYQLFIVSQKASTEENSKKILNYACCLLPKAYRDLLEVLLLFLKHISTLTDTNNNTGTKMNSDNLATVIAPNILYSKYKDHGKDESMLAIKAVKMLIEHPELSYIVPENIAEMLHLNEERDSSGEIIINTISHGKTITSNNISNPELLAFKDNSTDNIQKIENLESVQYDVAA